MVSGKVTKGGVPLPGGTITFESADGMVRLAGEIQPDDGSYTIRNVPVGQGKFGIDNSTLENAELARMGTDVLKMTEGRRPASVSLKTVSQGKYVPIDPGYRDPRTSGLTWTVKSGANDNVDFDLK
jgi:hypothetical protein